MWANACGYSNHAKTTNQKFWYNFKQLVDKLKLDPLKEKCSNGIRYIVGIEFKVNEDVELQFIDNGFKKKRYEAITEVKSMDEFD